MNATAKPTENKVRLSEIYQYRELMRQVAKADPTACVPIQTYLSHIDQAFLVLAAVRDIHILQARELKRVVGNDLQLTGDRKEAVA